MTKKWAELRRSVSKWAANVGAVVSSTASIVLRRGQQQHRRAGSVIDAFNEPKLLCQIGKYCEDPRGGVEDGKDKISILSCISGLTDDDFSSVLMLPYDCRVGIYEYVRYTDVLNLRLTCKQMYYELNYCRGVRVRLDDTISGFDWFRNIGVGALVVRHFRSDSPQIYRLLKRPQLLRELVISGSITPDNFNWLIAMCPNVRKLAVEISPYTVRYGLQSFFPHTSMPSKLTTLRLSAFMYDHNDAVQAGNSIFPILTNVQSPALSTFIFQLVIIDSRSLDDFHMEALKFVKRHCSTLRILHVQIKQVFLSERRIPEPPDDPQLNLSTWVNRIQLEQLRFTLDHHVRKWIQIIQTQCSLASLEVNLWNLRWSALAEVVRQCSHSLKNIQVYNVNVKEGHRFSPIDLGILRNCSVLQKLTVHHIEHPPTYCPKISRTAYLPPTLTELDICRVLIKQHQLLYILIRLPQLRKLDLGYWSDTETYFASLFSLLPILIKFNITPVRSVTMIDLRRKFDNHKLELNRLKNFLDRLATVKVSDSIRESRVTVEVHGLDDEQNFSFVCNK